MVTEMCNGVQMLWCTYRQDPSLTPDLLTNSKKAELIKASSPSPVAMKATTSGSPAKMRIAWSNLMVIAR